MLQTKTNELRGCIDHIESYEQQVQMGRDRKVKLEEAVRGLQAGIDALRGKK